MSDWGQGYQVGIPYTVGFYSELAPNHIEAALLFAGFKADLIRPGATYCDLGCGYGLTTLLLAAANPQMSFVGVDFNPIHIVAAKALAASAGLGNVRFVEASFDELLTPRFADLGEFDIIALHGIYSWVASAVRRAIVDFADAKLKTGGALYVSYNAAPGWMPRAPLQRLLFEHVKRSSAEPQRATADALRFAKSLKDGGARYFAAHPQVGNFIDAMDGKDLAYLVHEHINEHWTALYHADVVADFGRTRLSYACAGHIADDLDETSIPFDTHALLADVRDSVWRETVKDFLVGRSFRRDIFVRGAVRLTPVEKRKELDRRDFVLAVPRAAATTKLPTPIGEVDGRADLYPPLLDLLAAGPARLSDLHRRATGPIKELPALMQALALLVHSGQVKTIRADAEIDPAPARRLNLALARDIEAGRPMHFLAAPRIGTAIPAGLSEFGLLMAQERGLPIDAANVAKTTWAMIAETGIRPRRDTQVLQTQADVMAHLAEASDRLLKEKLATLQALGVCPGASPA